MAYIGECINRNVSTIDQSQTVCQYEMYLERGGKSEEEGGGDGGCMTNSPGASRLAIERPCINENWASCTVQKAKEGRETGQNGSDRDRKEVDGGRNIDLQQLPHPFTPIPFTAFLSRNIVSPWRLFFIPCVPRTPFPFACHSPLSLSLSPSLFFLQRHWVFLKGARNFAYETGKREKA